MSSLELVLRTAVALGVVVAAMWGVSRLARRAGRPGGRAASIQVLAGRTVSRGSSIGIVRVASKVLVIGTTPQSMTVLAELSAEEATELETTPAPTRAPRTGRSEPIGGLLGAGVWSSPGRRAGDGARPAGTAELLEWLREKSVRRS